MKTHSGTAAKIGYVKKIAKALKVKVAIQNGRLRSATDSARINRAQIFKQFSPNTTITVI